MPPALHHLAFRTADVPQLAAFYGEWLGLQVVRRSERSLWLGLGAAVVMVERAEPGEPLPATGSLELFALAASVDERLALRGRLVARGMLEAETAHTVYFRDPDGRRVAVSSYPLAEELARTAGNERAPGSSCASP
jgi:catechol 2,3-dioxygenase-like lactoylglutathione lyase family enzyme